MATQSLILQNCLDIATSDAQASFTRLADAAVKALQDAEGKALSSAKRNELTLAWRGMANQRDTLARRYSDALGEEVRKESAAALRVVENPKAAGFDPNATMAFKAMPLAPSPFDDEDSGFHDKDFTLVDDTQLTQTIEVSRLLQRLSGIVEPDMLAFDGLISAALGLPHIVPSLNPLRADVFARVAREVFTHAAASPEIVTTWMAFLAPPLGAELRRLYGQLIKELRATGIQAVKYKVGQSPDSPQGSGNSAGGGAAGSEGGSGGGGQGGNGGGGGNGGNGSGGGAGSGGGGGGYGGPGGEYVGEPVIVDMADDQVSGELFRQFFVNPGAVPVGPQPARMLAPSFYEAVDRELAELSDSQDTEVLPDSPEDYRDIPAVERPTRYIDASMALNSPVWGEYGRAKERALVRTQLKKEAQYVDQVLGLEMVRQLVNQVARDARLLGAMREAIVALEPALLRLAMIDPRFFSDSSHPGRRLIERVAQRSFRYNDELGEEFNSFFGPVGSAFNGLNHLEEVPDAKPFESALEKLEAAWTQQDQAEAEPRNAVVAAMRFAEERQALANQLAYEISQRTDLDMVPAVVLDFLYNRWTLVMAHARLNDSRQQMDPGGYGSLISDLLWSSKHELTLNNPVKLIQLIPPMLRKIAEGLNTLGQDDAEKASILATLERLHSPVLELCRTRNRKEWKDGFHDARPAAPEAPATAEERTPRPAAQPWIDRKALEAVGFEEAALASELMADSQYDSSMFETSSLSPDSGAAPLDSGAAPLEGQPASPEATMPDGSQITPTQIIKGLKLGGWVDLHSQKSWLRAQLIWASTRRTLFMFESQNNRPHSMTRRSCERLIRSRQLRPVDMQDVVARAMQAIAREAAGEDAARALAEQEEANASASAAAAASAEAASAEFDLAPRPAT